MIKGNSKAKLYSVGEASRFKPVLFDISKDLFNLKSFQYKIIENYNYSDILGGWIPNNVWLINNIKVYELIFEDGSVALLNNGKLEWKDKPYIFEPEQVDFYFKELTAKVRL